MHVDSLWHPSHACLLGLQRCRVRLTHCLGTERRPAPAQRLCGRLHQQQVRPVGIVAQRLGYDQTLARKDGGSLGCRE